MDRKLRIKEARKRKGLSGVQIAEMLNITPTHFYDIEKGKKRLNDELLTKLCEILGVSSDYLLGRSEDPRTYEQIIRDIGGWPMGPTVRIPVLGVIRAGEPIYAEENIIGWVEVPESRVRGGEYFYLRVEGDSMIGSRIYPGDLVLVRRQDAVNDGNIAVVLVNSEEATLKRVKRVGDTVILYPDNPKYHPQIYKAEEVRVLGKVVKVEFEP